MRRICLRMLVMTCTMAGLAVPAIADRVVGPFKCQVEAGRLKVISGAVRMYRVVGGRRERPFAVCAAGVATERCRTLMVHEFDLDCGGHVVPWQQVAAEILKQRASDVESRRGRLMFRLKDPAFSSLNALCPSPAGQHIEVSAAARHWRLDSTCREFGFVPRHRIGFPAGFGPLNELGGRIILEVAQSRPAMPPTPTRREIAGAASRPAPDAGGPAHLVAANLPDRSVAEPFPAAEPAERLPASASQLAAVAAPRANPPTASAAPLPHPPPATAQLAPVTLNSWDTLVEVIKAGTSDSESTEIRRNAQQSMVATLLGLTLLTSLFSGLGWLAGRQFWRPPDIRKVDPYQVMLRREVVDLAKPDAQMCGELCRSAQSLTGQIHASVAELQGVAPLRRVLLREVRNMEKFLAATISSEPTDPQEWRRMRLRLQRVVTDLMRLKDITDGARKSLTTAVVSKDLPRDKYEAYEVLGANPEASEKILKRLVDALRATWHPDHARTEEDRMVREERIKQINVAWDLIQEKRVEV